VKKVDRRQIRKIEDAVDAFEPSVRYRDGLVQIGWAWHADDGTVTLLLPRSSVAHLKYPPRRLTPLYEPERKPWTTTIEVPELGDPDAVVQVQKPCNECKSRAEPVLPLGPSHPEIGQITL
jgi:hypothetical protein